MGCEVCIGWITARGSFEPDCWLWLRKCAFDSRDNLIYKHRLFSFLHLSSPHLCSHSSEYPITYHWSLCMEGRISLPLLPAWCADVLCFLAVIFTAAQLRSNFLLFPELCSPHFSAPVWDALLQHPGTTAGKTYLTFRIDEQTGETFYQKEATNDVGFSFDS